MAPGRTGTERKRERGREFGPLLLLPFGNGKVSPKWEPRDGRTDPSSFPHSGGPYPDPLARQSVHFALLYKKVSECCSLKLCQSFSVCSIKPPTTIE